MPTRSVGYETLAGGDTLPSMGRGVRIVLGVIAGFVLATVVKAIGADSPALFATLWIVGIAATWLITKPKTA